MSEWAENGLPPRRMGVGSPMRRSTTRAEAAGLGEAAALGRLADEQHAVFPQQHHRRDLEAAGAERRHLGGRRARRLPPCRSSRGRPRVCRSPPLPSPSRPGDSRTRTDVCARARAAVSPDARMGSRGSSSRRRSCLGDRARLPEATDVGHQAKARPLSRSGSAIGGGSRGRGSASPYQAAPADTKPDGQAAAGVDHRVGDQLAHGQLCLLDVLGVPPASPTTAPPWLCGRPTLEACFARKVKSYLSDLVHSTPSIHHRESARPTQDFLPLRHAQTWKCCAHPVPDRVSPK